MNGACPSTVPSDRSHLRLTPSDLGLRTPLKHTPYDADPSGSSHVVGFPGRLTISAEAVFGSGIY